MGQLIAVLVSFAVVLFVLSIEQIFSHLREERRGKLRPELKPSKGLELDRLGILFPELKSSGILFSRLRWRRKIKAAACELIVYAMDRRIRKEDFLLTLPSGLETAIDVYTCEVRTLPEGSRYEFLGFGPDLNGVDLRGLCVEDRTRGKLVVRLDHLDVI